MMGVIKVSNAVKLYNKLVFISITILIISLFHIFIFYKTFFSDSYTFSFINKPFFISGISWKAFKITNLIALSISSFFLSSTVYSKWIIYSSTIRSLSHEQTAGLTLELGKATDTEAPVFLPEKGLYQNILVTGTIGTGKTTSAMYPFTEQLMRQGLGMLVLDVKGNYHQKMKEFAEKYHRKLIVIELNGVQTYNPLDKPNLKPSVLANRLRTILTLFSNQNTTDTYWLDKVESFLTESIKLCRLYNDGYVTFTELHKLIHDRSYLNQKLDHVKKDFLSDKFSSTQVYELSTALDFFTQEYVHLDSKVLSIIQSEISRITQLFISDLDVKKTFCPPKEKITFHGFEDVENSIVVLNMNVAEYRNLAKIVATYLKLDFESSVLMRLAKRSPLKPIAFICDEYHEYVTANDADFFSESREAKCINIVSTQSYTSLVNALNNPNTAKVIIQSLVNKIWFRTDDLYTIEEAQKQLGKEDKIKYLRSISENAKETKYNYLLGAFHSDNSNLSESVSTQVQHDYTFDTNSFSLDLKTFHAICFLSTGTEILPPKHVRLTPIFESFPTSNAISLLENKHPCHFLSNNHTNRRSL